MTEERWQNRVVIGKVVGFVTGLMAAAVIYVCTHPLEVLQLVPAPKQMESKHEPVSTPVPK